MSTIGYRVSDGERKRLDARAAADGCTISDIIRDGLEMRLGFDPVFLDRVRRRADLLKVPAYLVLQNIVIDRFAEEAAEDEIFDSPPRIFHEFMFTTEGPLTGKELFEQRKRDHAAKFARTKEAADRQRAVNKLSQHKPDEGSEPQQRPEDAPPAKYPESEIGETTGGWTGDLERE